jgi:hypothetical protein
MKSEFPLSKQHRMGISMGFSPAESIRCHTVASPLKILGKSTNKMPWGKANWFLVVTKKNIKLELEQLKLVGGFNLPL